LIRIHFPRVKVERHRLPLDGVDALDAPAGPLKREQSEIRTAADRNIDAGQSHSGWRDLDDRPAWPLAEMDVPRRVWNSIPVVMNWEDAGVVFVSLFDEHVEGPQAGLCDRITRSAIPAHLLPTQVFQKPLGRPHVLTEEARRQPVDQLMVVAMRG